MAIIQHLIVDEFGSFVGKKSERLQVTCQGEKRVEAPIMHLETVLITELDLTALAQQRDVASVRHLYDRRSDLYDVRAKRTVKVVRIE